MAYTTSKWNLSDLFSGFDDPGLQAAFEQIEEQVTSFEGVRGSLKADLSPQHFLEIVQACEAIQRILSRLASFAGLAFQADTQDQAAQTLQARVDQFAAEMRNRMLFFSLWWKALDDGNAGRLLSASGDYRYYLEFLRHYQPHTLSEAEEKIINLKNVTGANAFRTLYDSITNRYVFRLEVDGRQRELTRGELTAFVRGADADLRARAYQELLRVFSGDGPILAQVYQTLVRDWHNENVALRSFRSPIAARNLENDIPDEAVETLLGVARRNARVFQRYFAVKARHLGLKQLRRYDVYAPVSGSHASYDFDAAARLVFESFQAFDPRLAELARRVFDEKHLDSEIRKGKDSGAFCWSVTPEMTPYVLLNYQGRPYDVATMAHELGHAIHSMLASGHSLFTFQASLPLAETASTFGEMMLTDALLAGADKGLQRDLLFKRVDDAYATILRQAYFALFEKRAHEMIMQNAAVDELCAAYFENLQDQFGDSLDLSSEFKWEWVSIPHIYGVPFYVYAYAFGQLLVLSLYQQFKSEGASFKPKYLKILAAGGSEPPAQILREAGIDIRSAQFWQGGFDIVEQWVRALQDL